MSIRQRLLAGTALAVGAAFLVAITVIDHLAREARYAEFDASLVEQVHALTVLVEQTGDSIESDLGRGAASLPAYELWTGAGVTMDRSPALGEHHLAFAGPGVTPIELPAGPARQALVSFTARQDAENPQAPPKPLVLAIARTTAEIDASLATLREVLIGVGVAATLACLLALAWITHRSLAPLRSLADAITKVDEHGLATRLAVLRVPPELAAVVARLDELLARLEAAFERERALTAEVAHELRTPLAGLRATIDVALDRERPAPEYQDALRSCLAICNQTQRTVEMLLSLARLDAGTMTAHTERVDVAALIEEVAAGFLARAAERSLELTLEVEPASASASADADKLRVVLANLLDNAVTYADPGTAIRVDVAATRIRVSNATQLDDASHVFQRFWRADAARTAGHAGLGLALSRKLVELCGGAITASLVDGQFVATVELAAATSESQRS